MTPAECVDNVLDTKLLFETVVMVDITAVVCAACSEFSFTIELNAKDSS